MGVFARFAGIFAVLWDRERFWRIVCERCRGARVGESRKTGATFSGPTMIDPF